MSLPASSLDFSRRDPTRVPVALGVPSVRREDIEFHNVDRHTVLATVTVRNGGVFATSRSILRVDAAILGAFVPWRPLVRTIVPALLPMQSATVSFTARAPEAPYAAGLEEHASQQRELLRQLRLTAADDIAAAREHFYSRVKLALGDISSPSSTDTGGLVPTLPPDPLWCMARGGTHWAGNLNIFVDDVAVERHQARSLRVAPGRTNLALFIVGDGRDAYRFELTGEASRWNARLIDDRPSRLLSRRRLTTSRELPQDTWIELERSRAVMLAFDPPSGCREGSIDVLVTQRSTGSTARVEFTFDRDAEGAGCYTL
ncbi:MAG: hypothetical protein OEQ13_13715 [Acidobacteriota bacterium]|nr:hypothetical protein [Acidobacteriota bacterium]